MSSADAGAEPGGQTRRRLLLHAAHLSPALAVTAAVHGRALHTFFAQDDITYLSRAAGRLAHPGLTRALSAGLAFRLEYVAFGLHPLGYHVVNLLLHLLNVAGVYALCARLTGGVCTAAAAAIIFGVSSVAFTPLHWATGIIELLTATLLIGTTLLVVHPSEGATWRNWAVPLLLLAAMLSKETAAAWVVATGIAGFSGVREARLARSLVPAVLVTIAFLGCVFFVAGTGLDTSTGGAYALDFSPESLATNFFTYVGWSLAVWSPIRDLVAAADPRAWRIGIPVCVLLAMAVSRVRDARRTPLLSGLAWWIAFVTPVLPLAHHSYLYYLYIPWIGGAIAVACLGAMVVARWPRSLAGMAATIAIAGYAGIEWRNCAYRATATSDHLPVDRTIRASELLRHSLAGLAEAMLPEGTPVGFVNPVPRTQVLPVLTSSSHPDEPSERTSYMPLETAMRGGETLALFVPNVRYRGFATTIPDGWRDVECFYYEQRGWLERWGKGQEALLRQADVQMRAGQRLAAESTYARARAFARPR